ncbi:MAG: tripartite tricarboxylate transporter substrate binding protein [Bradyrhizobium sp.]|nr:tripartite tricarboxylate transporter substrate binding protein [Bradyrhizobium sp.]
MLRRRQFVVGLGAALGAPYISRARADTRFPSGNVRFVVPFSAGGPTDVVARLIGDAMSAKWSVPVIVENRAGAGTIVGSAEVAKSQPDGHTLGFVISAHTINPAIRKKLPYDTLRDFRGITELAEAHVVLVANPSFPADDLEGFLKVARSATEPLAFASPGTGTSTHLAGELLQRVAGIKMLHVPYNGSAPALTDLLGNRVPLMFDIWHSVQQYVEGKQLKMIGVANATRIPNAPQYPRIGETFPGYEANSIFGVVVAGKTPDELVSRLSGDLAGYIRSPAFAEKATVLGMEPVGSTAAEFDTLIRKQIVKWQEIASAAKISID